MTNDARFALTFIIACALLPSAAAASVRINEVMYDLEGTDTDREWIEIVNNGSAAVDIVSFKLFEGNTNHALTVVSGSTVLPAGAVAVIAAVPAKFMIDWPGFTGTLLDSAFSLSNSGETLAIKNGSDGIEDEVPYASTMGAQGDGKSLGRSGSTFTAQAPSPGSTAQASQPTGTEGGGAPPQASAPEALVPSSAAQARSITVHAGADRRAGAGAGSVFLADVYGVEGKLAPEARVIWNFGNGDAREGRSVMYTYRYPGKYVVIVTAALGEYSATTRFIVEVARTEAILRVETDGSLSVLHTGAHDLDLSLWQVERAGILFRFPQNTIVLPGEGVRLPPSTTGIPLEGEARLLYPNGEEAATSIAALERISAARPPAPSSGRATRQQDASRAAAVTSSDPVQQSTASAAAALLSSPRLAAGARAQPISQEAGGQVWLWLAGALGISVLGAAVVLATRLSSPLGEGAEDAATVADKEAEEYRLL